MIFDQLTIRGRTYPIHATVTQALESEGVKGEVGKIGTAAGVGAIIGGIIGGGKGVLCRHSDRRRRRGGGDRRQGRRSAARLGFEDQNRFAADCRVTATDSMLLSCEPVIAGDVLHEKSAGAALNELNAEAIQA